MLLGVKSNMEINNNYDKLKLENQLCFPLYACAKEIVRLYKPILDKYDLTYTQYITMMVMWEKKELNVKELGEYIYLDSGTLTPVLKKLESKGYVKRSRSKDDERIVLVILTEKGENLKQEAVNIPSQIGQCINLEQNDKNLLRQLLNKMLGSA